MKKPNLGHLGENLALKHLKNNGYQIIDRNFQSKFGEIDIIALEEETLVFVEVKTRWSKRFGRPEEAITSWKIKKIIKSGQYYQLLHPELSESLRLDAVVIDLSADGKPERIEVIKKFNSMMKIEKLVVGQLQTNCYLVWDEKTKEGIILDPGDGANFINNKVDDLAIKPKLIVATHGHFDHILAVNPLKIRFQIPFLLHEFDYFLVERMNRSARYWLGENLDFGIPPTVEKIY